MGTFEASQTCVAKNPTIWWGKSQDWLGDKAGGNDCKRMRRSRRKAARGQTAVYGASAWSGRSLSALGRFGVELLGAERRESENLQKVERPGQVYVAERGINTYVVALRAFSHLCFFYFGPNQLSF